MNGIAHQCGNVEFVRAEQIPWIADDKRGFADEGAGSARPASGPSQRDQGGIDQSGFSRREKIREIGGFEPGTRGCDDVRFPDDPPVVFGDWDVPDGEVFNGAGGEEGHGV